MVFGEVKEKSQESDQNVLTYYEECLKSGYQNMSRINLSLAEESVESDNDALFLAEQNLRSVKNK